MAKVGLIGAGLMGFGIGKNIAAKGHGLTVLANRNREPIERLKALGAGEAASARELAAENDVVIICVTGSPQVEDVVYRDNGLLAGVHAGLIVADCSTAEPGSTLKVAAAIAARGGRYCDTPLTRTPKEAEAGTLGIMTGGDPADLAALRPILECFGDTIVHAGPVGAGHTLKLVNNFISIANAAVAAEAIAAAAKAKVDMTALKDIVMAGGAASVMFDRLIKVALADDDSAAKFAITNARKDMRYYTSLTETLPFASFMAETVHQLLVLADNQGYGDKFLPRLVTFNAALNGVKLPA